MKGNSLTTACLVALLAASAVTGTVTADQTTQPETPEEFVTQLNDLRGQDALAEYPELDLARSRAVVELQTTESFSDAQRDRMTALLDAVQSFQAAYTTAQNDSVASLEHADQTRQLLADLEAAGGDSYAGLGSVALRRFYGVQGEQIYATAQNTTASPQKIELLNASAHAYDRAGNAQRFSEIRIEYEELRSEYRSDMDRHDELTGQAADFLSDCGPACEGAPALLTGSPLGSFDAYAGALRSHQAAVSASSLAVEHGIEDTGSRAADQRAATFDALGNAAIASAVVVLAYVAAMLGVAVLAVSRILTWGEDARSAARDSIVAPQEVDDA